MKEELKTLNEIGTLYVVTKEKLKEEAIKWLKHLQETGEDNVFDFLETFFNITESDLK